MSIQVQCLGVGLSLIPNKLLGDAHPCGWPVVHMWRSEALDHPVWHLLPDCTYGTSLVVQWLRFCLPMQGLQVQSLVRELRSHMPCGQKTKA